MLSGDFSSPLLIFTFLNETVIKTPWPPLRMSSSKFGVRMATESELFPNTSSCSKWKSNRMNFPVMRLDNLATTSSNSQARRKAANFITEVLIRLSANGPASEGIPTSPCLNALWILPGPPCTHLHEHTHTHTQRIFANPNINIFKRSRDQCWSMKCKFNHN